MRTRRGRHETIDSITVIEAHLITVTEADIRDQRRGAMRMAKTASRAGRKLELRDRPTHAKLLAVKRFSWES